MSLATTASPRSLGYSFDPIPREVEDLIRAGVLLPIDERVLKQLLRFRRTFQGSCWTTKQTIARALGCDARTVQRSLARLEAAGLILQACIPAPDPDEPKNYTGWRLYFPFIAPPPASAVGPDRRAPGERKGGANRDPSDPPCPPPQEVIRVLPPRTPVSSKCARVHSYFLDGIQSKTSSSSVCGMTHASDDDEEIRIYPIPSVSGSRDRDEVVAHGVCAEPANPLKADCLPRKSQTPQIPPSPPEQAEALATAAELFDSTLATTLLGQAAWVEREARRRKLAVSVAWGCLRGALIMAAISKDKGKLREESPLGYVLTVGADYMDRGGTPDEVAELESKMRARKRQEANEPILKWLHASMFVDTAPELIAKCHKVGWQPKLSKCGNWIKLFPIEGAEQRLALDEMAGFAHTVTKGRGEMLAHLRALRAEAQP